MVHTLFAVNWHEVLFPHLSWLEKIIRPLLVYLVLVVVFRLASRREMSQATLFDFLIILLISNVVQNAMIGEDNSVLGASVGAIVLVILSSVLNRLTAVSKRRRVFFEGRPTLILKDGTIDDHMLHKKNLSRNDLLCAIRAQGLARLADVSFAILELDGTISIIQCGRCDGGKLDALPEEVAGKISAESSEDS